MTVSIQDESRYGNNVALFDSQTREEREAKKLLHTETWAKARRYALLKLTGGIDYDKERTDFITRSSALLYNDMPINSSRIRAYLKSGNIDLANDCLGWEYEFSGIVVKGQGRGSQLKFPTANINPIFSNQLIPAHGVYCVDAIICGGRTSVS